MVSLDLRIITQRPPGPNVQYIRSPGFINYLQETGWHVENHTMLWKADKPAFVLPCQDDPDLAAHSPANQTTDLHVISPFYTYNIASDRVIVNGSNVKEMSRKIVDEREMMTRLGPYFCFTLAHPRN